MKNVHQARPDEIFRDRSKEKLDNHMISWSERRKCEGAADIWWRWSTETIRSWSFLILKSECCSSWKAWFWRTKNLEVLYDSSVRQKICTECRQPKDSTESIVSTSFWWLQSSYHRCWSDALSKRIRNTGIRTSQTNFSTFLIVIIIDVAESLYIYWSNQLWMSRGWYLKNISIRFFKVIT